MTNDDGQGNERQTKKQRSSARKKDLFELLSRLPEKPPTLPAKSDEKALAEQNELERAGRELDHDLKRNKLEHLKLLLNQRQEFAKYFFRLALGWLLFVAAVILLNGFSFAGFSMSDAVLMFLLGTGTVNVLAPAYMVAKYLFGKPDK